MADSPRQVVVIGGGVAGLAAAHRLVEQARADATPLDVTILEARDRPGGSIVTHTRNGFLVEGGPDSFITQKPAAMALARRLGIDRQVIGTNPDYRRVYVVHRGKLHAIPEGFLLLAPTQVLPFVTSRLFSWPGKIRMGFDVLLPARRRGPDDDESLADFVRRRFGTEALERIAQPLVGGIYTADPEKLSLRATMPRFLDLEDKYRSVILGMRAGMSARRKAERQQAAQRKRQPGGDSGARYSMFVSFADGMETLTNAIVARLPDGAVHTNAAVERLARDADRWRITQADGTSRHADAVILACPAFAAASMLRTIDAPLADMLDAIEYASSATLTMAFRRDQIRHALDGFGFVVPSVENRSMIAGTFGSIKFAGRAPEGHVLMRTFLGGAVQPHIYQMDDETLQRAVLRDLNELIGVQGEPVFAELHRWPRSMPQYPVGHLQHVARIHEAMRRWPHLAVAGNAYGGVGIPDCVQSGEQAADAIHG